MDASTFERLAADSENIIFDYGGVFADVRYQDAIDSLQKLTDVDVAALYGKKSQIQLFSDFEVGAIGSPEFIAGLREILKTQASDSELVDAWNSMIKGVHPRRVDYVRSLAKKKRVFILSNINALHESYLEKLLERDPEISDFYQHFEKIYFSHLIGARKPDRKAFEKVLEENRLRASDTLFLDDSPQHVDQALELGIKGVWLDPANRFIASF